MRVQCGVFLCSIFAAGLGTAGVAHGATVQAEAVAISGVDSIGTIYSSGTTPSGEPLVAAFRTADLQYALIVGGEDAWVGPASGGFSSFVNATARSVDLFAIEVEDTELPSLGYRIETGAGILATETLPIEELDGIVPQDFLAVEWAGDDELLMVMRAPDPPGSGAWGVLVSSDGTPGSLQWQLGPGDMVDGHEVRTVRDMLDASVDGSHRIVVFADEDLQSRVLLDDAVVGSWSGVLDSVAVDDDGRYAVAGGSWEQYVAVNGDAVITDDDTIDGVQLRDGDAVYVELDDRGRLAHSWRFEDSDPVEEVMFVACNADDVAASSRLVLRTGDVLDLGGAIGSIEVTGFDERDQGDLLGDPEAVVMQVFGEIDGESEVIVARIEFNCCGNGEVDPAEGCDDANDDDSDACLSSCEEARCGDGAVQAGVETCDDGNTDDGDGCSAECTVEEDASESSGSAGDHGSGTGTGGGDGPGGEGDDGPNGDSGNASGETDGETTNEPEADSGGAEGCGCRSSSTPSGWSVAWIILLGLRVHRRRATAGRGGSRR